MTAPVADFKFEAVGFAVDTAGWHVVVVWKYTDATYHQEVYPVVGWMTQEERAKTADFVHVAREDSGTTRVVPAIVNYLDGGCELMAVPDLWRVKRENSEIRDLDITLLEPGAKVPTDS